MAYWWVNQKQTYQHEVLGGYMWSPKLQTDGKRNRSYELMKMIQPGDIVFSFASQHIKAIGIASSYCYDFPKPVEFGKAGTYWDNIGWRVDVHFNELSNPLKPKDHIETLRKLLPDKYSPLQENGDGNQAYLFDISKELALGVSELISRQYVDLIKGVIVNDSLPLRETSDHIDEWEDKILENIKNDSSIEETERESITRSRIGQGRFKANVALIESVCRVTKVDKIEHLRASHLKPWRVCSNQERLDGENGLLLTPSIDHLFDRGFISFEGSGLLLVSPVAHKESLEKMGVPTKTKLNVGHFTQGQKSYLDYHRDNIFLERH